MPFDVFDACQNRMLNLKGRAVTFELTQKEDNKPVANKVQLVAGAEEKLAGRIKSYNASKGFGFFVSSSLEGQDIFFARKELKYADQQLELPPKTLATFTLNQTSDGKMQAKNIQVMAAQESPMMAMMQMAMAEMGGFD
eukprot:740715-Amphidinium_carterae.1